MVMTRDGKEEAVTWDSMKWARPSSATTAWARCRASPPTWPRPATRSACSARKTAPCASVQIPRRTERADLPRPGRTGRSARWSAASPSSRATTTARSRPSASRAPVSSRSSTARPWTTASPAASLVNDAPDRVRRRVPGQGLATEERHQYLPRPIPLREAPYKSRNMVSDPRPGGPGHRAGDQLHHQFGFQRDELPRNFSWPWVPRQSHRWKSPAPERIRQRRLQVNPDVIERIESRDGQVLYLGQSAPRAGGRTGRCAGCGRRRESW